MRIGMNWTSVGALVLLAATVVSTGCVVREREYPRCAVVVEERPRPVYVAPAPVYVEPPPPPTRPVIVREAPPIEEQVVVIRSAPPREIVETRPRRPGRDFVWTPGYWVLHRNAWVWVSGKWDRPPHAGAVWVAHHWEPHGAEFHFTAGFWR